MQPRSKKRKRLSFVELCALKDLGRDSVTGRMQTLTKASKEAESKLHHELVIRT